MSHKSTTYSAVLGSVISSLRKEQRIEQSELANSLNITQASYSRLENGKSTINVEQTFVIARYLDISVTDLFNLVEKSIRTLCLDGYEIIATGRGKSENNSGNIVVGAALAAILFGILSKK